LRVEGERRGRGIDRGVGRRSRQASSVENDAVEAKQSHVA
jgi:hypothetical protein